MAEQPLSGEKQAVLLLAHGTPESLDEIPEYLGNITGGRPMPEAAIDEIRRRYALIGPSPLTRLTLEQASLLAEKLSMPVYVGMRNWKPYIADTLRRMRTEGVGRVAAICLAPQNSRTSVGLYRRAVSSAAAEGMKIDFTESWAETPLLAEAFASRLAPLWREISSREGHPIPVVFTAHSVPAATVQASGGAEPDPYDRQCRQTAAAVAALIAGFGDDPRAGLCSFAFQSQGVSGGAWLEPTVENTLLALGRRGHTVAIVQPIGFLCDHVEILYDIDIAFREFGRRIGLEVLRPESLNGSPLLIEALAGVAREALERLAAHSTAASTAP